MPLFLTPKAPKGFLKSNRLRTSYIVVLTITWFLILRISMRSTMSVFLIFPRTLARMGFSMKSQEGKITSFLLEFLFLSYTLGNKIIDGPLFTKCVAEEEKDRKSTRLNSSHTDIS